MDGLECNEVILSDINLGDRIDAEYFSKEYLAVISHLDKVLTLPLEKLVKTVASAFYPAATQLYSVGDTPFARCVDCIDHPVITKEQDSRFEKIPLAFGKENKGISFIKKHEIVLTKVGTPCFASIIEDYDEIALSRTVMGLSDIRHIDPYYLLVFLRCKFGFEQLLRQRELTIQYQLTIPRVQTIKVFIPSESFQSMIRESCTEYRIALSKSIFAYSFAQSFLLSALNYQHIVQTQGHSEKTFSASFGATGRLDAEYYQPKYDELFKWLSALPTKQLQKIVNITKSIEPGSEYYGSVGIPFIRVSDVSVTGIEEPSIRIPKITVPSIENLYPKKDTILFSKDGSVGIAYKVEDNMEAVTSGALLHLTVKDTTEILPDYLTLLLNSDIVKLQAERDASGAIIQHWKPSDIERVVVPILPLKMQRQIAEKIEESFSLRRQSKQLLENAKHAVEMAIEQGEDQAMRWLQEQGEI